MAALAVLHTSIFLLAPMVMLLLIGVVETTITPENCNCIPEDLRTAILRSLKAVWPPSKTKPMPKLQGGQVVSSYVEITAPGDYAAAAVCQCGKENTDQLPMITINGFKVHKHTSTIEIKLQPDKLDKRDNCFNKAYKPAQGVILLPLEVEATPETLSTNRIQLRLSVSGAKTDYAQLVVAAVADKKLFGVENVPLEIGKGSPDARTCYDAWTETTKELERVFASQFKRVLRSAGINAIGPRACDCIPDTIRKKLLTDLRTAWPAGTPKKLPKLNNTPKVNIQDGSEIELKAPNDYDSLATCHCFENESPWLLIDGYTVTQATKFGVVLNEKKLGKRADCFKSKTYRPSFDLVNVPLTVSTSSDEITLQITIVGAQTTTPKYKVNAVISQELFEAANVPEEVTYGPGTHDFKLCFHAWIETIHELERVLEEEFKRQLHIP